MASRIKGITVEIGGDTTGLDKALSNVNKQIKTTQTSLKDVEKLLKLDPTNTELLAQKQKLLSEAIEKTSDKLKSLKDAQEQAKRQLESGELGQDKYDALQREIIETENSLKTLQAQAKQTQEQMGNSLDKLGTKATELGNKLTSAGKTMTKYVTTAVAALGTAAVKTAADFESSMSQVQATMGITKDATSEVNGVSVNTMATLEELAQQMGGSTAFSAKECADAINYLALAGYSTQQMLDTLPTVLSLAAAGGMDLAKASDMVTDAMSALGLQTSDAEMMVDQMAKTASSTNTSVSQLGEALLTIGATGKSVKGGTAELSTALGILANNGIKGSEGGTKLRNVILSLQSPTDAASKAMDALGIKVYDSAGKMRSINDILSDLNESLKDSTDAEKNNVINKIFNKTDIAAVNALLANTGNTWSDLQATISNSTGSASQMAETQLDNLEGQITILKSSLEGLAIELGKALLPTVKSVAEAIQNVISWLNSLDENTKNTIINVALVVGAIGPVLIFIGKVSTGIGAILSIVPKLLSAFSAIKTAMVALNTVMMANPILLIVAAIAALILAFIALYNNCEEFRDGVNEIWEAMLQTFEDVWNAIVDFFNVTMPKVLDDCIQAVNDFFDGIGQFFKNIVTAIGDTINNIVNTVVNGFNGAIEFITSLPKKAFQWGKDFIQGLIDGIKSMINKVTDAVCSVAEEIASWLHFSRPDKGILHSYEKWMPDFMTGLAKGIESNKYKVEDAISDVANAMTINTGDIVGAQTNSNVYTTTQVYLGDRELTNVLSDGVIKKISNQQGASSRMRGAYV